MKPRYCKAGRKCHLAPRRLLAWDWFKPRARYCKVCQAYRQKV